MPFFQRRLDGSAVEPSRPASRRTTPLKGGIRTDWDGAAARVARVERSRRGDGAVFKTQRVVACCGDRLTWACLCLAEPIRHAVVGAATTEDEGFELVLRHKPSLLICTSDLETGYGMNLLRRVKAELPTCQLLIVLVRETQAVVQEAMQAYADAVIFKSSLGTGKGDFVQALHTLSEGGVYLPEEIRQLGAAQASNPNLPPLIEELTERELEVVAGVARGLTNQGSAAASASRWKR